MTEPKRHILNAKSLAASVKASGGPGLKSVPEAKVAKILALAFAEIGKEMNSVEQGVLSVKGLGIFRVRSREIEKEGTKTAVRRVGFAVSRPRAPKPTTGPTSGSATTSRPSPPPPPPAPPR